MEVTQSFGYGWPIRLVMMWKPYLQRFSILPGAVDGDFGLPEYNFSETHSGMDLDEAQTNEHLPLDEVLMQRVFDGGYSVPFCEWQTRIPTGLIWRIYSGRVGSSMPLLHERGRRQARRSFSAELGSG